MHHELAAQRSVMSVVASDVFNAEDGFSLGEVSVAQWHQRTAAAVALHPRCSDRRTIVSSTLEAPRAALTARGFAPGTLTGETKYRNAFSIASPVCQHGEHTLAISAEFSG